MPNIAASSGPRRRGPLTLQAGCALYACACVAAAAAGRAGAGGGVQRGVVQIGVGAIIVAGVASSRRAGSLPRIGGFWKLLRYGLVLLAVAWALGAASSLGVAGPWEAIGLAALLAAYPFLFGALCRRAIREEGFEGGLATLMDVGILVCSLMVVTVPVLLVPLAAQHSSVSMGTAITWASNIGLFSGGLWLLYRLPRGAEIRAVGLLVASLAIFSVLSLAEAATQLHGGPAVPWWLVALFGPPYALVGLAPRFEREEARERGGEIAGERWLSLRVAMPYVAFVPMLAVWLTAVVRDWDTSLFGTGIAVVATLVVARQLLLLHDHHRLLVVRARQALSDELTGVRNRRAFDEDLAQLLEIAQRRDASLVVLMVDLDELKAINDSAGHLAGDRALVAVAQALGAAARISDRVYRIGGDEFAMLLPDAARSGVERVLADARLRMAVADEGTLSVSAGMACFPGDAREAETLLTIADGRLYRAKRSRLSSAATVEPLPRRHPLRLPGVAIAEQAG